MRTPQQATRGPEAVEPTLAAAVLRETVVGGRRTARRAAEVLRQVGFVLDEWLVLDALDGADGLTMSELRDATVIDKATLGRRVDALVTRALVYREVDDLDRRVVRVYLSPRGNDVLSGLTARLAHGEQADSPDR